MSKLAVYYRWPGDTKGWAQTLAGLTIGDVVVLNPASGDIATAEGRGERDQWVDIREQARDRSVYAVLYQPTGWGDVSAGTIGARVQRAKQWCDWDGIFFDQAPSLYQLRWALPGSWLQRLHGLARSMIIDTAGTKRGLSIWNPGTRIDPRLARLPSSIWCTFEGPSSTIRPSQGDVDRRRQAAIIYAAPTWATPPADYGWHWLTGDPGLGGNPYDGDPAT